MNLKHQQKLAAYIRYCILSATNNADSGHPTSSLSAVELMSSLLFGGSFKYNPNDPDNPNNDRLIFSKGHASPLFYALWVAAGKISEEDMLNYRQFGSPLEGHPTMSFPYVEAATGSLGQGLSIGVGMALNGKYLDELPYKTYVLLGDSEMAEGSQWESIQIAAHYGLDNLIGILDVNRLGQRGETMYGRDTEAYRKRISAFGWETIVVDGHVPAEIINAYKQAESITGAPVMIIAKTVKGKGVPSVEDSNGYHGKALGEDAMKEAEKNWGELDKSVLGTIAKPEVIDPIFPKEGVMDEISYKKGDKAATRDAYGSALHRMYPRYPQIVALDGEVSNSTRAAKFRDKYPERFFEMYIAEQNMVGAALGFSRRGKIPFVSTFAAFFTRAFDQLRMAQYSEPNIKFVGSHAGTSIGKDGPSQMGLEDLAMFRTLLDSTVLYPSDAVSAEKLLEMSAARYGIDYIRCTRAKTPVLYDADEEFHIGGSKVLKGGDNDDITIISAGYTLHEALAACTVLEKEGIEVRLIDLYSIKPIDEETLQKAADETPCIMVVEDHYPEGGIGEAIFRAIRNISVAKEHLAVTKKPGSGDPADVLHDQGLDRDAITARVRYLVEKERGSWKV